MVAGANTLRYQRNRGLDDCPGFIASMQLDAGAAGPLVLALRDDGLEIYTGEDVQYLFDLEGRPVRCGTTNEFWFRGMSHAGTRARKRPARHGGGLERVRVDDAELDRWCSAAWQAAVHAADALVAGRSPRWARPDPTAAGARLQSVLAKIRGCTPEHLARQRERFAAIYQPVPILPPDHYQSLVLQATEGCTFNTCTFCALYRGIRYRVRSREEFARHVDAALAFHGEGLRRLTQIFLGQANALAVPQARLVALLELIRERVELPPADAPNVRPAWASGHARRFLGIGSFLDGFTGLQKSASDYAELRALGLTRTYLGVETGSAALLRWLEKPATPEEMLATLRQLKAGGLATDVILLVGVGGAEFADEHVRASLEFLRESPLARGDRVYLSELVEPEDAPYRKAMDRTGWRRLTPEEMHRQRDQLAAGARALGLQAVPYRIEPFVY